MICKKIPEQDLIYVVSLMCFKFLKINSEALQILGNSTFSPAKRLLKDNPHKV